MNVENIYIPVKDYAEAKQIKEIILDEGFELDEYLDYHPSSERAMFCCADNSFFYTRHIIDGLQRVEIRHLRAVLKSNKDE